VGCTPSSSGWRLRSLRKVQVWTGRVRAGHQVGGGHGDAVGFVDGAVAVGIAAAAGGRDHAAGRALDVVLPGADAVGIGAHFRQSGGGQQVLEQARTAGHGPVIGFVKGGREGDGAVGGQVVCVHQLDQLHTRLGAQILQVGGFKGLDEHRRVAVVPAGAGQHGQQPVFQRQADALVVGGVLGLGVDAHRAALFARLVLGQRDDFFNRRYLVQPVVGLAAGAHRLHGADLLDFSQGEVAGPEAVGRNAVQHHRAAAAGKLRKCADIGGGNEVGLMPRDQVAVLGGDQVGFNKVRPQFNAQGVGLQRVLRQVAAAAAAVADDQRVRKARGVRAVAVAVTVAAAVVVGLRSTECNGQRHCGCERCT
jgi:hypothetical protein